MCSFTGCGVPRRLGLMFSLATTSLLSLVSLAAAGPASAAATHKAAAMAACRQPRSRTSRIQRLFIVILRDAASAALGLRRALLHLLLVRLRKLVAEQPAERRVVVAELGVHLAVEIPVLGLVDHVEQG